MASKPLFSEEDLSCPVCCDIFVEPVVLSCSHSMCKTCLLNFWTTRTDDEFWECPVCRRKSSKSQPPCNLALKNLCEVFLRNKSQKAPDKLEFCSLHNEKIKLFCLEDKQPVCLVCQTSKKHKNHDLCPIDEIVQDQRVELKAMLKLIQQKLKLFKKIQLNNDQTIEHIKFQTQHTERQINMDFERLHSFLRNEEAARLAALREEETQKSHIMKERREKMMTEIANLSDIIKFLKKELKAEDILFLQNFNNTMERAQQASTPQDPEKIFESLMDVAKHLGNLQFRVWEKMQSIAQYNTVLSKPPDNPERFCDRHFVQGFEGFNSGTHCWDTVVSETTDWTVGIMEKSPNESKNDIWKIAHVSNHYEIESPTQSPIILSVKDKLLMVRVELDWEREKLSFFDPLTNTCLHTFTQHFTHTVFPVFGINSEHGALRVLPLESSVTLFQPKTNTV
ncbi:putative zinc-binding protein A33-like [Triplophysa rosa]|uniref:Zinc-binding protein A33-like n=1 Tax=Triplophysa rosa TaxID=992332 RepID=A0A9W8C363_TRIRA|nr:putative zinc-binding protein A33-like [Triplophysa rosa]